MKSNIVSYFDLIFTSLSLYEVIKLAKLKKKEKHTVISDMSDLEIFGNFSKTTNRNSFNMNECNSMF